jgi:SAM-dependent methyltransferase
LIPHSEACERNKGPILAVLRSWLPPQARVLEVGSGTGQHAVHFGANLAVHWQPTERPDHLEGLQQRWSLVAGGPGPGHLEAPIELDVRRRDQWPAGPFEAVFSANTAHIMTWAAVLDLLAGSARVLAADGLLLLYGPFHDDGVPTSASNAAFDAHLRSLDPAMGVRDAGLLVREAATVGLAPAADLAMPANNRMLIFRLPRLDCGDPAPQAPVAWGV